MGTLYPGERRRHGQVLSYRGEVIEPGASTEQIAGPATARHWLDAERANLAAVTAFAADHGWPGHATGLAATLFRYLDTGSHYPEAITIHAHARKAAGRSATAPQKLPR